MDSSSFVAELLPIVVGGFLAIGGGFFSQLWTNHFDKKKKNRDLLLSKSEEIVQALYSHSEWLDEKRQKLLFKQQDHDIPSPLNKVKVLQDLYFPDLGHELLAIMAAEKPMIQFLGEQRIEQMKDFPKWLENNNLDNFHPMYQDYLVAFRAIVNSVSKEIHTEIKN